MRYLSILLVMLFAIGLTNAAWYPRSADYNTTGDVNADNGVFTGDLTVTGAGAFGGGSVSNGVYDGDWRLAANHSFYSTLGSGGIDWSNATGFFNTSTGTNYINGNVIQATLKNYTMQGASTFTSGTGPFDINGALTAKGITQDSGYSLIQSGAAGVTVGTTGITASASPLKILENVTLAANKSLTGLSGSGAVDLSAMTGGYSSPLGTNTFNGNILGAGTTTTTTGGGAVTLKGNTTVYTDKTLAVTTADKLTVAGVIVPGEMVLTIPLSKAAINAGEGNNSAWYIADDAWTITSIEEAHPVAETTATALTVSVQKMTGTQALTGGINMTTSAFSLKSTANTVVPATLSTTIGGVATGRTTLADGDRIGIIVNMTGVTAATEFLSGGITLHMKRA